MPKGDQGIHGAAGSLAVIGGHTGKVIKGQSGRIVGHQNTGYFDFTKVLQEILAVSAQEQNTQRFLFPAQLDRPQHFVVILVHVVHMEGIVGLVDQRLNGFDHFGKHFIEGSFDHHQYRVGMLFQLLCVGIDLKTALLYQTVNFFSGLIADIWVIIQYSGHGSNTVSGFFGQIFNGHKMTSFTGCG